MSPGDPLASDVAFLTHIARLATTSRLRRGLDVVVYVDVGLVYAGRRYNADHGMYFLSPVGDRDVLYCGVVFRAAGLVDADAVMVESRDGIVVKVTAIRRGDGDAG